MKIKVLMVCLGNICRSPTAQGVFQAELLKQNLSHLVGVDSAGTAAWHVGKAPDARSQAHAKRRGYDLSALSARQVQTQDFHEFDYILAMDQHNFDELQAIQPSGSRATLDLFLRFAPDAEKREVPDPYYGGDAGFEEVLDLVERASLGLINHLRSTDLRSAAL